MRLVAIILTLLSNIFNKFGVKTLQIFQVVCAVNLVIMDPGKIFQIITNSTLLATRLLSGSGRTLIEFSQNRYCAIIGEDLPISSDIINVVAHHKEGATIKYSISGGNTEGLFNIDEYTGIVKLIAPLDFETTDKYELLISGEVGGQLVEAVVEVTVTDVNDNGPVFINPNPHITVIEEDDRHLPASLLKVKAKDPDKVDQMNLRYSISGDGIDGYLPDDAYFSINARNGDLVQLKALDRDPPNGKRFWRLIVKVEDGQKNWKNKGQSYYSGNPFQTNGEYNQPLDLEFEYQNDPGAIMYPGGFENEEHLEHEYKEEAYSNWYSRGDIDSGLKFDMGMRKDRFSTLPTQHQTKKRMRDSKESPPSKIRHFINDNILSSAETRSVTSQRQPTEYTLQGGASQSHEINHHFNTNERHLEEVNIPGKSHDDEDESIFGFKKLQMREANKYKKTGFNFNYQLDISEARVNTITRQATGRAEKSSKPNIVNNARKRHIKRNGENIESKTLHRNTSRSNKIMFLPNKPMQETMLHDSNFEKSLVQNEDEINYFFPKKGDGNHETRIDTLGSLDAHVDENRRNHNTYSKEKEIYDYEKENNPQSRARIELKDVHIPTHLSILPPQSPKTNKIRLSWNKRIETDRINRSNRKRMTSFLSKLKRNIRDVRIPGEIMFSEDQTHRENDSERNQDMISYKKMIAEYIDISDIHLHSVDANIDENYTFGNKQGSYISTKLKHSDGIKMSLNTTIPNYKSNGNENNSINIDSIINTVTSIGKIFERENKDKSDETFSFKIQDNKRHKMSSASLAWNHSRKTSKRRKSLTTLDSTNARYRTESLLAKRRDSDQELFTSAFIKRLNSKPPTFPFLDKHTQLYGNGVKDSGFGEQKKVQRFVVQKRDLGLTQRDKDSVGKTSFHKFPNITKETELKNIPQLLYSPKCIYLHLLHSSEDVRNNRYSTREVNSHLANTGDGNIFPHISPINSEDYEPNLFNKDYSKMYYTKFQPYKLPSEGASNIADKLKTKAKELIDSPEVTIIAETDWSQDIGKEYLYKVKDEYINSDLLKPSIVTQNANWKRNQVLNDLLTFSRVNRKRYIQDLPITSWVTGVKIMKRNEIDQDDMTLFRRKRNTNNRILGAVNEENNGDLKKEDSCPNPTDSSKEHVSRNKYQGDIKIHSAEMTVTIVVKDINDNPPVFSNVTMFGEIQENGPAELSVAQVSAWDNDDATEGTNARITYFIEKNVIHDRTGEAIFDINPKSGLVTTAICCLDRETTPEYNIQVVAADGGGLKGTGTVLVRLRDENDNPPHLSRKSWDLEIVETPGEGPPDSGTLLEMTVGDPDSQNDFSFRIVKDSGPGWDRFGIRSSGASGQLYVLQKLDYEDEGHRQGFKFMVQVTDKGEEGWDDPRHQDTAWVGIKLKDCNDNPPFFMNSNVHLSVSEDTIPGTIIVNMTATDPDKGKGGQVKYKILGPWDTLRMEEFGGLTLHRALDREYEDEIEKVFRILAIDQGEPALTSTATLTMTVTDVNDCPPRLLPPTVLYVKEGEPPSLLGVLSVTDDDVWSLGHGPPFRLALSPSNSRNVFNLVELKFYPHLDSGRGGAEIWTRGSLDREANRELKVKIFLSDSRNLNNTQTVTIIVGDLNDNPMKAASKTVYLWKTENAGSEAPLGRVYVDDPDDWDVGDKTFKWAGKPFPLFTLNNDDGTIYASSQVREGRYFLQFSVTDHVWKQVDVSANVTVIVRVLTHEAITHATSIFFMPTTPEDLTRGWVPLVGGGKLGKLIDAVQDITALAGYRIEVVSVYGVDNMPNSAKLNSFVSINSPEYQDEVYPIGNRNPRNSVQQGTFELDSYACVWLSAIDYQDIFMDPVRLQGLIALHTRYLEDATGLLVAFKSPSNYFEQDRRNRKKFFYQIPDLGKDNSAFGTSEYISSPKLKPINKDGPDKIASMASTLLPLQVVDTNLTSFVTPLLRSHECPSKRSPSTNSFKSASTSCTPTSCLNGGACVGFPTGNRCVCPGGSKGPQCKVYSRTFRGNGWAWLKPPSSCLPMTLSLRLLTRKSDGILLYNGPLAPPSDAGRAIYTPMLTVQLVNQKPQVLIQGFEEFLMLQVHKDVSDGDWHTIYVRLDRLGVSMMVDICGFGRGEKLLGDSRCVARRKWRNYLPTRMWESVGPLQMGGIAQHHPRSDDFGWQDSVTPHHFDGCLSHLTINDQVVDLGEPPYSRGSSPKCHTQDLACLDSNGSCGVYSECTGGLRMPKCTCAAGRTGFNCDTPTIPTTLGPNSYIKMALSFTPQSRDISIQIRVRTKGLRTGLLLHLVTQQTNSSLSLHLQSGVACASMSVAGWTERTACLNGHSIGDGKWHTIRAERHEHNLIAIVDDGDDGGFNISIPSFVMHLDDTSQRFIKPPMTLQIDKHDGVTIGGFPGLLDIEDDLSETCIDDLRISDRQLPLPPAVNGSNWGQVINSNGLIQGCQPQRSCINVTCKYPLSCHPNWSPPRCSCGPGLHYIDQDCTDVDECLLDPCLNGGTCVNINRGYNCLCGPNHVGENCEWAKVIGGARPLSAPVIVASITSLIFVLVLLGILLSIRHRWMRVSRRGADKERQDVESSDKTSITTSITEAKGNSKTSREQDTGGKKKYSLEEALLEESQATDVGQRTRGPEDESHTAFLELLELTRVQTKKKLQGCEEEKVEGIGLNVITASEGTTRDKAELRPSCYHPLHQIHLPREDLHIYSYEGDGSSSGSLSSTISGLEAEVDKEECNEGSVVCEFLEVIDLLKNLPDAPSSSLLLSKLKQRGRCERVSQGGHPGWHSTISESEGTKTFKVPTGQAKSSSLERPGIVHELPNISIEEDEIKNTVC